MYQVFRSIVWIFCGVAAFGQTQVDLRTQSKSIDFSGAASTRPFKSGTVLPSVCNVGEMFYKTDATSGSNVYGCTATNLWTLQGQGGGGGGTGSGITMLSQAGDFNVGRSSAGVLTIGANCSSTTPCNVRFGNTVYAVALGATATFNFGSGTAYIYISSSGVLTVGHSMAVTCSIGCTSQSGVTAFPVDAVPLFTWTASGAGWDSNGGADLRAFSSTKVVQTGTGMISSEVSGKTVVAADTTVIGIRTAVPTASNAACTSGQWALDASYYYLCVSSGAWRRVSTVSW